MIHVGQHPTIEPSLIRRVTRVVERVGGDVDTPDMVLDDIFVLWRAFESTFDDSTVTDSDKTAVALGEVIAFHGLTILKNLRRLLLSFRYFEYGTNSELREWFGTDKSSSVDIHGYVEDAIALVEAENVPSRWHIADSRKLARILYRCRCAIFHPRLETNNRIGTMILPALREGLIELIVARAAQQAKLPLGEAARLFSVSS